MFQEKPTERWRDEEGREREREKIQWYNVSTDSEERMRDAIIKYLGNLIVKY
jgi:hypothetical protein